MRTDSFGVEKFNLTANTVGKESRIASYEVGDPYALGFDREEYFDIRLPTKYTESGIDLNPDTVSVTVSADIPNAGISEDGGIAVAYVSEDGGSTWERVPVDSVNSYSADSNQNQVTLDTSGYSSSDNDVKVYHLFVPGELVLGDVPKPTFGQAYWNIQNFPLMELSNKDPTNRGTLEFIETTQKIPEDHIIVLRLNSPVQVSWEEEALNKYIKLPVELYDADELRETKEQLHNQIVDKMTKV